MALVLPAHAGMARPHQTRCSLSPWFSPHTRGWPALGVAAAGLARVFSPHTRGWPVDASQLKHRLEGSPRTRGDGPGTTENAAKLATRIAAGMNTVLPAHAGMARPSPTCSAARAAFSPHTRGWPAGVRYSKVIRFTFSPHTRGWPGGGAGDHPR